MIQDFLAALVVMCLASAGAVLIAGCIAEPTFADRCAHCGEYLPDAEAAHQHLRGCPCR